MGQWAREIFGTKDVWVLSAVTAKADAAVRSRTRVNFLDLYQCVRPICIMRVPPNYCWEEHTVTLEEHTDELAGGTERADLAAASAARARETSWIAIFLGALFWPATIALIVAIFNVTFRTFLETWLWAFAILPAIVVLTALMPHGRSALEKTALTTRAALFIFVVLPLLIAAVGGAFVVLPYSDSRAMFLRGIFLVVVCILPATMWYLFIVTRKASLLNEFLANLDRLGLLDVQVERAQKEASASRNRRIESYLQKFEAAYGDLPDNIHEDVLNNRLKHYSRETAGARTLTTATFPVALFTLLIAIGWLITLPLFHLGPSSESVYVRAFEPTATPVTLAFLGAYFFTLQMLFRRYVREDLEGTAYVAGSIRIVLATIGIWILTALGPNAFPGGEASGQKSLLSWENQLLLMGFVFGVFPRVIWQIVQSVFERVASFALPSMLSQLPASDLDGLTVWHEARLEEEDIENIPNMANADLVELLLNTRLAPEQIIDWADQAILYTQLGPQGKQQDGNARQKLRMHGIRTATSLLWASAALLREGKRDAFDKMLTDSKGDSLMPTLEASLATNSNLKLILRWRRTLDINELRGARMQIETEKLAPPLAEARQGADEKGQPETVGRPVAA
jgi:hypothetical protein